MSKIKSWIVSTGKWIGYGLVGIAVLIVSSGAIALLIGGLQWFFENLKVVGEIIINIGCVALGVFILMMCALMGRDFVKACKKALQKPRGKK